jgi:hypothetical protein
MSAFESFIKLDLAKYFKVIRDLDLLPEILQSDWSGVFLQRFSGDLTISPRSKIRVREQREMMALAQKAEASCRIGRRSCPTPTRRNWRSCFIPAKG